MKQYLAALTLTLMLASPVLATQPLTNNVTVGYNTNSKSGGYIMWWTRDGSLSTMATNNYEAWGNATNSFLTAETVLDAPQRGCHHQGTRKAGRAVQGAGA